MIVASQTNQYDHAKVWCIEALNILKHEETGKFIGLEYQYDYLDFLGELAWIHWNCGSPLKSFAAI